MRQSARLLAILLAACGSAEPMAASGKGKSAAPLILTEKSSDRSIAIGRMVEVRLPVHLGTGYSWAIASMPREMELMESRTSSSSDGLEGGAGTQIFRFRAVRSGRITLRFDYRRPWETDKAPSKSVSQRLRIGS